MFVSPAKSKRASLTKEQMKFLTGIAPLCRYVQKTSISKFNFSKKADLSRNGLFASVAAAHCIHVSDWGGHVASRARCYMTDKQWVHGNNLALLSAEDNWKRNTIEFEGTRYRSYPDWASFFTDLSDVVSWSFKYQDVMIASNVHMQVKLMSVLQDDPVSYEAQCLDLIDSYGLTEFDLIHG